MSEKINDLILEIMKISLKINSRNKNTVFVEYFGHVNLLMFSYCKDGWTANIDSDFKKDIYMDTIPEKETVKKLNEILDFIKKVED